MAKFTKEEVMEGVQMVLEGFALIEVHIRRQEDELRKARATVIKEIWDRFELGEPPEWETEMRLRKVS